MEKKELDERRVCSINIGKNGYESTVHVYLDDDGEIVLFKRFKENLPDENYEEKCRNKEKKLEILSSLKLPMLVPIKQALYKNGIMIGYTMPEIIGKNIGYHSSRKQKIEYLKQIKRIMYTLNDQGIYIGDFGINNFIIDRNGTIKCIDIDNYRIKLDKEDLKHDATSSELINFYNKCGIKSLEDRFCFNEAVLWLIGKYVEEGFTMHSLVRRPNEFGPLIKLPLGLNSDYNMTVAEEMLFLGKDYRGNVLEFKKRN